MKLNEILDTIGCNASITEATHVNDKTFKFDKGDAEKEALYNAYTKNPKSILPDTMVQVVKAMRRHMVGRGGTANLGPFRKDINDYFYGLDLDTLTGWDGGMFSRELSKEIYKALASHKDFSSPTKEFDWLALAKLGETVMTTPTELRRMKFRQDHGRGDVHPLAKSKKNGPSMAEFVTALILREIQRKYKLELEINTADDQISKERETIANSPDFADTDIGGAYVPDEYNPSLN